MNHHTHYWQKIPRIALVLFVLGLVGGVALRLTLFLEPMGKEAVKMVWYLGVVSYTIFYFFRISIENHRREICRPDLMKRLENKALLPQDHTDLHEMLTSLCRSKVKYNYVVWLVVSFISLIGGVFFVVD